MSNKELKDLMKLKKIVVGYYADPNCRKPTRKEVENYIKLYDKYMGLS